MTRASHGAPLEQTYQRPGLWHIEGHQVVRVRGRRGRKDWWIYRAAEDGDKVRVAEVASLGDARDWIRQELSR